MKINIATISVFLFAFSFGGQSLLAQEQGNYEKSASVKIDDPDYEQLKASGNLDGRTIIQSEEKGSLTYHVEMDAMRGNAGSITAQSAADCDCWIQRDGSFSVAPICQGVCLPPDYRNDDGSTAAITLPFSFCLNNTTQSTVYINNNGNVSFGSSYGTFSAVGFPSASYVMIAPFWADVDTRNVLSGIVYYKITPTYMIVQWDSVGYFSMQVDKRCTFQLIMTDGTDPILPGGKNVSFCYKNMDWTTGSASLGVGGFGGIPATVGVNFGDGINYIQMGRFDQPGVAYDGPYGANDGVDWLDNQHFEFDWCTSTNIAPVLSNPNFCDTVTVCVGATINPTLTFLSPEGGQTTSTVITSTLSNYVVLDNTPGNSNSISVQITAMPADVGYQTMTFTATDDGAPPASTIFSVLVHVLASPTVNAGPDTSYCAVPVQLNAVGSPGVISYSWSPAAGLSDPNIANPLASPSVNTQYVVTVSNGTCTGTDTMNITGGVAVPTISASTTICQGSNTQLTAGGGTVYSWTPTTGLSNPNISNPVASPATTTTYTVTVSNGVGCSATASTTITVSPSLAPSISAFTDVTCAGLNNGSATVNVAGGTAPYSYLWNDASSQTTQTATGLPGGNYTVTVTDTYGCTQTTTAFIYEPTALTVTAGPVTDVLCYGDGNGSVSVNVSNGTPGYTYSWSPGAGTTASITGLSGGIYTVTVTDANGCTETSSSTVNEPLAPLTANISSTIDILCNGDGNGSAMVNANGGTPGGGYTYLWNDASLQTTQTATGLSGGSYIVTVTDANGCTQTASAVINEPTALVATPGPTTDVLCYGDGNGTANVMVSNGTPGYTYLWNDASSQITQTASGLSGGTYTVTVTDANGCTQTVSATINEPSAALAANLLSTTDVTCNGNANGSASINVIDGTPGYFYSWSPAGGTNATAIGLSGGSYDVTVTDANGCTTSIQNIVINEPSAVTLSVQGSTTICIGQSAYLTATGGGGVSPLSYSWDNGFSTFDQTVSPTTTTTYTATVTDANGCSPAAQPVTVYVNPPLNVNATATPAICYGSSASISATAGGGNGGPYSYSWNNGAITNASATVTPDHDTTFTVEINDGCSPPVQATVNIVVNALPVADFLPQSASGCPPLSVSFTDNSVTPAGSNYHWSFGDSYSSGSQNPSHVYSQTGIYDVSLIVITPAGCSDTLEQPNLVTVLPVPTAMFAMSSEQISMYNPIVSFTDLSSGAVWQNWDFGDDIGTSDSLNPVYQYSGAGLYTIQLIVENNVGCFDTTYSILHVTNEITLYVPTGFTPNGDGINDNFMAYGIGISEFSMSIFDRWGTQVFHSNDKDIPWNGAYSSKGELCPNDVYVYKIEYKDVDGVSHEYVGHVALTR